MCDFTKGIRLCKCDNEKIKFREEEFYKKVKGELVRIRNKKNDDIPLIYIWQLFRFVEECKDFSLGRYMLPSDNLDNGLNAEWIALNLNTENCFDFDYIPQNGDNLFIRQNILFGPYISFIFKNGEWIIDHYSPLRFEIEKLKEGLLKEKPNRSDLQNS